MMMAGGRVGIHSAWPVAFATCCCLFGAQAQNAAPSSVAPSSMAPGKAQVGFTYENRQLQPAKYSFLIDESGSGHFHSQPGDAPPADTASYQMLAESEDRPVQLSKRVVEQIFSTARNERFFAMPCEDGKNKVAYQGTKQLSYQGPDGNGNCTYNWSKTQAIERLTATFESIAFTLEEGRRLAVEHKHDRLALDEELGVLLDAVKEGRALEVQSIQPVLQEIAEDDAVLERARMRAKKLLDAGNTTASLR
jgi:hypothetical protein